MVAASTKRSLPKIVPPHKMPRIQLHDSFKVFITVISHIWVFLNRNISNEAPNHRNLGANLIKGKLDDFASAAVPIWASSSLEIGRNYDFFMFNPT